MAIEPVTAVVLPTAVVLWPKSTSPARYCTALPDETFQSPSIDAGVPVVDELASFAFELSTAPARASPAGLPR